VSGEVEVIRAFHDAYNGNDLRAALSLCARDVQVAPDQSVFPEAGALVGQEEFRAFLEETWAAWTSGAVTPREVRDIGDHRVLVQADWSAKGFASSAEVSRNLSAIYTLRDGLISSAEYYFDHDKALKAAGLME
jgi:ketosteroid isomerase-like protein